MDALRALSTGIQNICFKISTENHNKNISSIMAMHQVHFKKC